MTPRMDRPPSTVRTPPRHSQSLSTTPAFIPAALGFASSRGRLGAARSSSEASECAKRRNREQDAARDPAASLGVGQPIGAERWSHDSRRTGSISLEMPCATTCECWTSRGSPSDRESRDNPHRRGLGRTGASFVDTRLYQSLALHESMASRSPSTPPTTPGTGSPLSPCALRSTRPQCCTSPRGPVGPACASPPAWRS